jgi:hypothetical protein
MKNSESTNKMPEILGLLVLSLGANAALGFFVWQQSKALKEYEVLTRVQRDALTRRKAIMRRLVYEADKANFDDTQLLTEAKEDVADE